MSEDKQEGSKCARESELDEAAGPQRVRLDLELGPEVGGQRLDQALAAALPMHSRARLQRWLKSGELTVEGSPARARQRVFGGERVRIDAALSAVEDWRPQEVDFDLVHVDEALIIVGKPVGLVVHPGAGNPDGTLVNGLLYRFPELAALPRAGIVHRLDKDTSGLLCVARTLEAHTSLVQQLAARTMGREYLAVVEEVPVAGAVIDAPIDRDPHNRLRMAVVREGREAITRFRVLSRFRRHALIACALETGRTHQIRVHLSSEGFPLVGDRLYGARGRLPPSPTPALVEFVQGFGRQALHAERLRLDHPETGDPMTFESSLPEDMVGLLEALALDQEGAG